MAITMVVCIYREEPKCQETSVDELLAVWVIFDRRSTLESMHNRRQFRDLLLLLTTVTSMTELDSELDKTLVSASETIPLHNTTNTSNLILLCSQHILQSYSTLLVRISNLKNLWDR